MIVGVGTILLNCTSESMRACVSHQYGIEGLCPVEEAGQGYTVVPSPSGHQDHLSFYRHRHKRRRELLWL